jgi:hypothetical protein
MPPPVPAAVAYNGRWTQIPALPAPPPPPPRRTVPISPLVPRTTRGGSKKRVSKTRRRKRN